MSWPNLRNFFCPKSFTPFCANRPVVIFNEVATYKSKGGKEGVLLRKSSLSPNKGREKEIPPFDTPDKRRWNIFFFGECQEKKGEEKGRDSLSLLSTFSFGGKKGVRSSLFWNTWRGSSLFGNVRNPEGDTWGKRNNFCERMFFEGNREMFPN